MRCDQLSITARLLAWVDQSEARSPAPQTWAADRVLCRFVTPAAAALAVRDHRLGDRVLAALAHAGGFGGDQVADLAALSGLAPRLVAITARWERARMPAVDLVDAECDLVTECVELLRRHPGLPANAVVRSAWHRSAGKRRTQRSRAARVHRLTPDTAGAGSDMDPLAGLVGRIGEALTTGAVSVTEATAIWTHACGFDNSQAAVLAGCTPGAWRTRLSRALRAAGRFGMFDAMEVA